MQPFGIEFYAGRAIMKNAIASCPRGTLNSEEIDLAKKKTMRYRPPLDSNIAKSGFPTLGDAFLK